MWFRRARVPESIRAAFQSDEDRVQSAMKAGAVAVVEEILGDPPTHMYDYGMQCSWKKRARQWVADQKRPEAIFPVHCWSAGYGGPQEPLTWFHCKSCGETSIGQPHVEPSHRCFSCFGDFAGWEVVDWSSSASSTIEATSGMPSYSVEKVLRGPS